MISKHYSLGWGPERSSCLSRYSMRNSVKYFKGNSYIKSRQSLLSLTKCDAPRCLKSYFLV